MVNRWLAHSVDTVFDKNYSSLRKNHMDDEKEESIYDIYEGMKKKLWFLQLMFQYVHKVGNYDFY